MPVMPSLHELQQSFLAGIYDGDGALATAAIDAHGLTSDARMRIYRNSGTLLHTDILRTTFPAVLALVGEDCFESTAMLYRRAHPSASGNLQAFGSTFADFLGRQPNLQGVPYLADVARLEWLRQQAALTADGTTLSTAAFETATKDLPPPQTSLKLHPSLQLLSSPHAVLTLWSYAINPHDQSLRLPDDGEQIALWRSGDEVAMTALDTASFAFIDALSRDVCVANASRQALNIDPAFDHVTCLASLVDQRLVTAVGHAIDNPGRTIS